MAHIAIASGGVQTVRDFTGRTQLRKGSGDLSPGRQRRDPAADAKYVKKKAFKKTIKALHSLSTEEIQALNDR
jgi:hypothetical protein